jgi:hypothetical protein
LEHELPRLFEAVPLQNMGKNLHPAWRSAPKYQSISDTLSESALPWSLNVPWGSHELATAVIGAQPPWFHVWGIHGRSCVGFQVLTEVVMKHFVFWDITPCSLLKLNHFGGTCHLHLQGWRISTLLVTWFTLVSCLAYSSILKREVTCF